MNSKPSIERKDNRKNENKTNTNTETTNVPKPEVLRSWKTKLFVFFLCAISFFVGWTSKTAYSNKQCWESGGEVMIINELSTCEFS